MVAVAPGLAVSAGRSNTVSAIATTLTMSCAGLAPAVVTRPGSRTVETVAAEMGSCSPASNWPGGQGVAARVSGDGEVSRSGRSCAVADAANAKLITTDSTEAHRGCRNVTRRLLPWPRSVRGRVCGPLLRGCRRRGTMTHSCRRSRRSWRGRRARCSSERTCSACGSPSVGPASLRRARTCGRLGRSAAAGGVLRAVPDAAPTGRVSRPGLGAATGGPAATAAGAGSTARASRGAAAAAVCEPAGASGSARSRSRSTGTDAAGRSTEAGASAWRSCTPAYTSSPAASTAPARHRQRERPRGRKLSRSCCNVSSVSAEPVGGSVDWVVVSFSGLLGLGGLVGCEVPARSG